MIRIYKENEIEILRQSGKILSKVMDELKKEVKPGITTKYLDKVAEELIFSLDAKPSFKGFNGFPAALCTSINEEIVHAIPSQRKLKLGDILSLDLGVRFKGYCTDMAITVPVLNPSGTDLAVLDASGRIKKLLWVTEEALGLGIEEAKPGNHLEDIGYAIQHYVEKQGFGIVRELVGHGVGKEVHEEPEVPNYGHLGKGPELKQGMVLAIEPMVTVGDWHIKKSQDGSAYKTVDNSLSCHFEHTIIISKKCPEILTKL